ncbi:uncharacterized protein LOC105185396 [Harpegnathos saltator]|uniref:Salivary secreted protein n=1 Tax=Harpegnathos saltator TaxID=610380 RepID=E2B2I4_HARSA|nr:uncharacterized protein LOC105185396 [Harpegnathos saltator]EFN90099.1 hypothetical protein EAI_16093 [Harpegnathos saltator]
MRFLLIAVLCLSIAVCTLANDFELGKRQPGDYRVINRRNIVKPGVPFLVIKARIGMRCPDNETFTYIKISSINGKEVGFQLLEGDVGTQIIKVMVSGKEKGVGLLLNAEGYCISNTITSEALTATESNAKVDNDIASYDIAKNNVNYTR